MKVCTKCGIEKPLSDFYKSKNYIDGHCYWCKACDFKYKKERYLQNKEEINKKNREAYWKNREERLEYCKSRYENNKEEILEQGKVYREKNKEKIRERRKKNNTRDKKDRRNAYLLEYNKNPINRIKKNIRGRISCSIKGKVKKGSAIKDLGCTVEDLKLHLESLFYPNPETGEVMSWENYGKGVDRWQIDHIIPLLAVNVEDRRDFLKVCHYTNLQPLWARGNIKKREEDKLRYYT
jgi:hypothetical protein